MHMAFSEWPPGEPDDYRASGSGRSWNFAT